MNKLNKITDEYLKASKTKKPGKETDEEKEEGSEGEENSEGSTITISIQGSKKKHELEDKKK